ncbi:DUF1054 family protein, partial [Staphylococcus saprophyticus]|uniref:DUF1054 family protein n=1 Tax=Staphylococcus saprophyticus TaxID=29385 RepID=UPI00119F2FEC
QIPLFQNQFFLIYPLIHQPKHKPQQLQPFLHQFHPFTNLPSHYTLTLHHITQQKTYIHNITHQHLFKPFTPLKQLKKPQFFLPPTFSPNSQHLKNDKPFLSFLQQTFQQLLKFYK